MEAQTETETGGPTARARQSRSATLAIMGVTGAIIAAVAFLANQPTANADGLTSVTLSGRARGEPPTVGKAAPDLLATTVDGKTVRLSDFKGNPVWLTFGASWCQACRAENPDIQAMSEEFTDSDLVVLAIFISEDASAVRDYADRVGLTYRKVADPDTGIASEYRIMGIPSHYFIDRSGVLRLLRIGSLDPVGMEAALKGIAE
jgi:cytochrome c biogenesis protein CcmG/thiol:disulfide interchange protein DsbE